MKKRPELRLDVVLPEVEQLLQRLRGVKVIYASCYKKDIRVRVKVRSQQSLAYIEEAAFCSNLLVVLGLDPIPSSGGEISPEPTDICYTIRGTKRNRPDEALDMQSFGAFLTWRMRHRGLLDPKEADRVCRALHAALYDD